MTTDQPLRSPTRLLTAFHARVVRLVRRLEGETWPETGVGDLEPLQAPLREALRDVEAAIDDETLDPARQRQIAYLLTVHADDQALRANWPGREAWQRKSLESQLFRTDLGPTELFTRIDRLLEVPTPENRQLAQLYLMVLGLGFEGRMAADPEGARRLERYRRRLLAFALPSRREAGKPGQQVFPQAYRYTLARGEPRRLPALRPWLLLGALILALFGLASAPLWTCATWGLRNDRPAPWWCGEDQPAPVMPAEESEGPAATDGGEP